MRRDEVIGQSGQQLKSYIEDFEQFIEDFEKIHM